MTSWIRAARHAASTSASDASGRAYRRLAPIDSWNRCGSWLTTPIASLTDCSVADRTSCPSMRTAPDVTSYRRGINDVRVVLPAPDGPTRATVLPGDAVKLTPRRIQSDGTSDRAAATSASSEAIDTSVAAG